MNVCTLMGRLTAEPELKTTQNGHDVVSFTLAVDRAYAPKGQERITDFINCVAWRQTAEFITRYFHKGNRMAVKGELQTRSYTANDGSKRTVYEVIVDGAYFCESKDSRPAGAYGSVHDADSAARAAGLEMFQDEELPF